MSHPGQGKFPDLIPRTQIQYEGRYPTLRLRHCVVHVRGGARYRFDKAVIRIGGMDDNDIVLRDDTVSRYHCRIVQEDTGYVIVDQDSTNGTFVNSVRVREAFLHPGCSLAVGGAKLEFQAGDEALEIRPSAADHCAYLVGGSAHMRQTYGILERIAPSPATVIIHGESGTGKELLAHSLHALSSRRDKEMLVFDCSAVPANLIESELFGHEKGSFTGAVVSRPGLFEMADGGTLFLDELAELPLDLQPRLLHALESREVRRVGSSRPVKVDVRIIAASARDLHTEVRERRFRRDLYQRLSAVTLQLPALRERKDDIPLLCQHLLQVGAYNRGPDDTPRVRDVSRAAMTCLEAHHWPGNVRELINVLERAVSLCDGDVIEVADLPGHLREYLRPDVSARDSRPLARAAAPQARASTAVVDEHADESRGMPRLPSELLHDGVTFKDAKEQWVASFERDFIVSLLERYNGNISQAAREAELDRKYFRKLMKKYEIEADVTS